MNAYEREQLTALLDEAVATLQAVAVADYRAIGHTGMQRIADVWLAKHGYDAGDTLRERHARIKRAEMLDAEIERLRAERAALELEK